MVSYLGRAYVITATLVVFFFAWAAIAAKPWVDTSPAKQDPRLTMLAAQEQRLRREATQVKQIVARRWRVYQHRLEGRKLQIAKAREHYEQQLVAARAAEARIAAAQRAAAAASVVSYSPGASSAQPVSASAAAPSARVVTLPPRVNIVTLPPVTTTKSS